MTTFTAGAQNTLPLWIFGAIRLGQQLPEVNAVVVGVLLLTLIPIAFAARMSSGEGDGPVCPLGHLALLRRPGQARGFVPGEPRRAATDPVLDVAGRR